MDEKTDSVNQITREDRHYQRPKEYGMLKVAAVLLVMLVGAAVSWEFGLIPTEKEVQEVRLDWISKTTRSGEKKRISLPDGSRVTLNASSEIRYDEGFGESHREIFLKGESFFEVEKDSLLPFRVHSGKLITEALGTAFNVYAFEEDAQVKVQLIEGRVSVEKENEGTSGNDLIYLSPGEEASLSDVDFTKTGFDMEKALLWTKGILYFDDVPFDHVVKTLERWYGVEITVTGNPGKLPRVSGEFNRDNLDNVMNSISYSFRFDYDIEGDKVNVRF